MNLTEQAQKLKDYLDECNDDVEKYCACDDNVPCITHTNLEATEFEIRGFLLAIQNEKDFLENMIKDGYNFYRFKNVFYNGKVKDRLTEISNAIKLLEDVK